MKRRSDLPAEHECRDGRDAYECVIRCNCSIGHDHTHSEQAAVGVTGGHIWDEADT